MLRGHCGRPFSASHLWSWALQTNKERAKGSFPGVHTSLHTACLGLFCGRRVLGKRKQPRKEIGRGEESEGE